MPGVKKKATGRGRSRKDGKLAVPTKSAAEAMAYILKIEEEIKRLNRELEGIYHVDEDESD